jgi:HEAT repeat protein
MYQDTTRRPQSSCPAGHSFRRTAVAVSTLLIAIGSWFFPTRLAGADEPAPPFRYGFKSGEDYVYSVRLEVKMPGLTEIVSGVSKYGIVEAKKDAIRLRHSGRLVIDGDVTEGGTKRTTHSERGLPVSDIRIDPFGRVLRSSGESQLPFLLGNLSMLVLEPLAADGKSPWEIKTECVIKQKQSVLSAPSRLHRIRRPKVETTVDYPANEVTTYSLGKPDGDKVVLHKKYELKTREEDDGKPFMEMTGEGDITFSIKAGVPQSLEFKGVLKGGGLKNEVPVTATYRLLEGAELEKALKELAAKPADPVKDASPLSEEALTKALADLKSDNKEQRKAAANLLAKSKPETKREEVAKVLLTLMTDADIFTMQAATDAMKTWAAKEDIPALAQLTKHDSIFVRKAAMQILSQFQEEAAAAAIAERFSAVLDRGHAGALLQKMGPVAEKVVRPYLKTGDAAVKVEVCKVLGAVGTKESKEDLEKAATDSDANVARAAKNALEAIAKR